LIQTRLRSRFAQTLQFDAERHNLSLSKCPASADRPLLLENVVYRCTASKPPPSSGLESRGGGGVFPKAWIVPSKAVLTQQLQHLCCDWLETSPARTRNRLPGGQRLACGRFSLVSAKVRLAEPRLQTLLKVFESPERICTIARSARAPSFPTQLVRSARTFAITAFGRAVVQELV